jgi:hypothetical protein
MTDDTVACHRDCSSDMRDREIVSQLAVESTTCQHSVLEEACNNDVNDSCSSIFPGIAASGRCLSGNSEATSQLQGQETPLPPFADAACEKATPGLFSSCSLTSLLSIANSDSTEVVSLNTLLQHAETKDVNVTSLESRDITNELPATCLLSSSPKTSENVSMSIQSEGQSHDVAEEPEEVLPEVKTVSRKRRKRLPTVLYISESDSEIDTVKDKFWRDLEEGKLMQEPYVDLYTKVSKHMYNAHHGH